MKSDSKGNLTDQSGNSYTANISGAGVSFTGGASNGALGTFINGTNPTTINGSGGLSGFTFNFTYSEASNGITAGPSSVGDLHLGEHNPYTTVPGFLDHAQEVIKHHLDH